jgi:hypothetical protein
MTWWHYAFTTLSLNGLQSIRKDETVNVNKPSPVSPQLRARSGQSAQLVQVTHVNPLKPSGHYMYHQL